MDEGVFQPAGCPVLSSSRQIKSTSVATAALTVVEPALLPSHVSEQATNNGFIQTICHSCPRKHPFSGGLHTDSPKLLASVQTTKCTHRVHVRVPLCADSIGWVKAKKQKQKRGSADGQTGDVGGSQVHATRSNVTHGSAAYRKLEVVRFVWTLPVFWEVCVAPNQMQMCDMQIQSSYLGFCRLTQGKCGVVADTTSIM